MKVLSLILVILLLGCTGFVGIKKQGDYVYYGEVKGKYEVLAYCVVDTMEADKRWKISKLRYEIKDNPNTKRLQVNARTRTLLGKFYVFSLDLNQTATDVSSILLKGFKFESEEALKSLKECAENN